MAKKSQIKNCTSPRWRWGEVVGAGKGRKYKVERGIHTVRSPSKHHLYF